MRCLDDEGTWKLDHSGVPPSFDEDKWWPAETGSGSDVEAGDAVGRSCIMPANVTFVYNIDWNGIERAKRPTERAAKLLHAARARTDISRW